MIENLIYQREIKDFIRNELKRDKSSGTYLFHGNDSGALWDTVLSFIKAKACPELENDFCDVCNVCKRINSYSYPDLEIYGGGRGEELFITIDQVRGMIEKTGLTSFEGRGKFFILNNIHRMQKEGMNSLLKILEEPSPGNYIFLITPTLNILPTIKSRSVIVNVPMFTPEALGVTKEEYEFFRGNSRDIFEYLKAGIDLNEPISYERVGEVLKKYIESGAIEDKISLYSSLNDFRNSYSWSSDLEKIWFAETIALALSQGEKTRDMAMWILGYMASGEKDLKRIEKILSGKNMLRHPVSLRHVLIDVFL